MTRRFTVLQPAYVATKIGQARVQDRVNKLFLLCGYFVFLYLFVGTAPARALQEKENKTNTKHKHRTTFQPIADMCNPVRRSIFRFEHPNHSHTLLVFFMRTVICNMYHVSGTLRACL